MPRTHAVLPLLLAACAAPALAAPAAAQTQLQALDQRVRALESEIETLRTQAAAAVAAADAANAELAKMKAAQAPGGSPDAVSAAVAAVRAAPAAPASAPAPASSTSAAVAAVQATPGSGGSNPNAFNPAISVILNGLYAHHSLNPDNYVRAGFPLVDGAGPGPQGLSLGESEVSLAANVDDKFYGQFTLSYEDDNGHVGTNLEEAYIDTLALPNGFSVRAGRFYSNIGYLNSHHTHTDNFVDRPLAYQAFLANQYGDDGAQLRWVAPTDIFLEFGGELFRGENFPAAGAQHSGTGAQTLFAHAGGDVGDENSWLAGVSMLKARARAGEDGFSGDDTLYLADATWKWAPNGNTKDGGVMLRSEYFFDKRDGVYDALPDGGVDLPPTLPWLGDRRGVYLEGVYRLNRSWDVGYRYDKLWAGSGDPYATGVDPQRHSLELTWRNSEFSFFRVQVSRDEPWRDRVDNALFLQYDVSLGAHGAHKF